MGTDNFIVHYDENSPVFMFSNENLGGYIPKFGDLSGKDVLTVAGSGDHALVAYGMGARCVDTFDINPNQQFIMDLKTRMIRNMSYSMFLNAFFQANKESGGQVILMLAHTLMQDYGLENVAYMLFGKEMCDYDPNTPQWVPYLQSQSFYDKLKMVVPRRINFVHADVTAVSRRFDKQYDVIMLSNIFGALYDLNLKHSQQIERFYGEVIGPMAQNNLKVGGTICMNYLSGAGDEFDKLIIWQWDAVLKKMYGASNSACPYNLGVERMASVRKPGKQDWVIKLIKTR